MGQSLSSVMTPEEINVLCMLANGARLSPGEVADVLGCSEEDVAGRMSRLSSLIGYQLWTHYPAWGCA